MSAVLKCSHRGRIFLADRRTISFSGTDRQTFDPLDFVVLNGPRGAEGPIVSIKSTEHYLKIRCERANYRLHGKFFRTRRGFFDWRMKLRHQPKTKQERIWDGEIRTVNRRVRRDVPKRPDRG